MERAGQRDRSSLTLSPTSTSSWPRDQWRIIRRALNTYLTHPQKLESLRGLRHKAVEELIGHVEERRDQTGAIGELAFITARNMMSNTCLSVNVAGFESGGAQGFLNTELKLVQTELIEWAMTELLRHPDIMSKVREEFKKAVGEEGRIEEPKILALPYLHAVVKETLRLHLSLPFLIPHKSETDMKLCDFQIPKNTQILLNVWAIARNPAYWENPTQFMPEWFLGSNMEYRGQHFAFLPFGSGRRMCPGLPLAQRVVSLMLASLVYHLDWKLPDGSTPENLGLIRSASPCRGQHLFLLFRQEEVELAIEDLNLKLHNTMCKLAMNNEFIYFALGFSCFMFLKPRLFLEVEWR
ncbi:hypothetical protein HYC85_007304 [Camellia sinensis]|uniref:Cytochrome P450 n=1 Tax=Camellia sinensis TaxID=4442 RepID=A0A7J7HR12_CAMSI|nr:hypothetical protein HYC85_007304 [Camellia sinensis]